MSRAWWILVVDDDPNDVDFTLRALTSDAVPGEVLVAGDGAEALDCLYGRHPFQTRRPGQPAMVLLDLNMPKVNGLEVLRQIKSDAVLKTIPVVMFSSSREEADLLRSYQLGANAYVVKPIGPQEFSTALKTIAAFWLNINAAPPRGIPERDSNGPEVAAA